MKLTFKNRVDLKSKLQ